MSLLQRIRQELVAHTRRYLLIGLGLNLLVGLGVAAFVFFVVRPPLLLGQTLRAALEVAEQGAVEAEFAASATEDELRAAIGAARSDVLQRSTTFLTAAEGSDIAQRLYGYAADTGVQIMAVDGQAVASPDASRAYQAILLRIEATGPMAQLLLFMTRIDSAAQPAVQFHDLAIIESGEGLHRLRMDLALYTSSFANSENRLPSTPDALPTAPNEAPQITPQLSTELSMVWAARDWARAVDLIPRLLVYTPNDPGLHERLYVAHLNYGYALLDRGQEREAAAQFLLALEVKPNGVETLEALQRISQAPVLSVESRPLPVSTPTAHQAVEPSPTPPSYLVKPEKWPTGWPWPPAGQ